jgi:hypothetical protein
MVGFHPTWGGLVVIIRPRRIAAVIGIVAGILATGTLSAQAAPANHGGVAVSRGVSDGTAKAASAAAAEPTTSPAAVRRYRIAAGSSNDCPSGYACATANYDSSGGWLFEFYSYGTYSLNNWYGYGPNGGISNGQTGDAGVRLLDRNGNVVRCQWAGTAVNDIDWEPIWYISLSPTPC